MYSIRPPAVYMLDEISTHPYAGADAGPEALRLSVRLRPDIDTRPAEAACKSMGHRTTGHH